MKFISVNGFVLENFQVGFVGVAGLEVHPVSVDLLVEFVCAVAPPAGVGRSVLLDLLLALFVEHVLLQTAFVVQDGLVGQDLELLLVPALWVRDELVVTLASLFLDLVPEVVINVRVYSKLILLTVFEFCELGLQRLYGVFISVFWYLNIVFLVIV